MKAPPGYIVYGNYGDGKWRVSLEEKSQDNLIKPVDTKEKAIVKAWELFKKSQGKAT